MASNCVLYSAGRLPSSRHRERYLSHECVTFDDQRSYSYQTAVVSILMSERLYYQDQYTRLFRSNIIERTESNHHPAVVLEGTYFYPTSGGQPYDTGMIEGIKVLDVVIRHSDGAIMHVLETTVESDDVRAEIDWNRRFDHMQQHTGQHILSQSFSRELGAETLSFHLGADTSTIDLEIPQLDDKGVDSVEQVANQIVWDNRPVEIRMVKRAEASSLHLRKQPPNDGDYLRIVDIMDFDMSACGGTHVTGTGEVGTIKITKIERHRGAVRVEFVCGGRALVDYRNKNKVIKKLSALFTTGYRELEEAVERMQSETTSYRRQLKKSKKDLINYQVDEILRNTQRTGEVLFVIEVFVDRDPAELRLMANQFAMNPGTVALLGLVGNKVHLIFARNQSAVGNMNELIKQAFTNLGSGSGGGSPTFAQGSGGYAEKSEVLAVLTALKVRLL